MPSADERFSRTLNLERSHAGLRFSAADTEQTFRAWRIEQNLPLWAIICWVSILGWIIIALLAEFSLPEDARPSPEFSEHAVMLTFGLVIPLLIWPLVSIYKRWMLGISNHYATVALAIIGMSAFYLCGPMGNSATGVLGAALNMAAFALFMRLPPGFAIAAVSPFMLSASWWLLARGIPAQNLSLIDVFFFFTQISLMTFFIGMISIVAELSFRRSFINEQTIAQQRELIGRYVPPAVAAHIADGRLADVDSPQRRRVTILFSDIVGFTDMADRLDAESLTQIISEYMATMADIVAAHGGTLNEFSGDGLMAVFGAPQAMPPERQALYALQAAQEMQARLPALNETWLKLGIAEPMRIRIGINTGVLSVGSFGSQGRMTYTAIGLQTNIAARVQSACAPGEILLSDASWHLLKDHVLCEARGEVQCKGVHFPVKVYAPARPVSASSDSSPGTAKAIA